MNTVLWIFQVVLVLLFAYHGRLLLSPSAKLPNELMNYIYDLQTGLGRFICVMEILAGIGLILPVLTNILPVLTPLAAVGLVIVMGGVNIRISYSI